MTDGTKLFITRNHGTDEWHVTKLWSEFNKDGKLVGFYKHWDDHIVHDMNNDFFTEYDLMTNEIPRTLFIRTDAVTMW